MKRNLNKGMRRAYLKRFSAEMVNTGSGANTKLMDNFHGKVTNVGPVELVPVVGFKVTQEVLESRKRWVQGLKWENSSVFVCLKDTRKERLDMYLNGDVVCFFKEDKILETIHHSIIYSSRAQAMMYLERKRVIWVERKQVGVQKTQAGIPIPSSPPV